MRGSSQVFNRGSRPEAGSLSLRVVLILVLFALCAPLHGDSPQTGTIEGRVVDALGEALPGVAVVLRGERGEQTATTDAEGRYRFGLLVPGSYTVESSVEGLEGQSVTVRVEAGQRRNQDLRMAGAEETITVVAESPLINKYDVGNSASVEAEVVEEMTFNTRNFQSVTTLMPGAVHHSSSQPVADTRVSFNGSLWQENGVFIDGVDVSITRAGGSARILLPTSALTEIRNDGAGFGVEYGRVTGGITGVVTKSGTNVFHGDFLYVAQNPKWRSESKNVSIPREDDLQSNFEASIGGPIKRDRVWFFLARGLTNTNELEVLRDGTLVDASLETEPFIGKLNFQPSARHTLSGTYVDVPTTKNIPNPQTGDLFAVPAFELGGDFTTVSWNWAAAQNMFLELRGAEQSSSEIRVGLARRVLDPSASPHTPLNSRGQFQDLSQGLRFNLPAFADGESFQEFPRDQFNAAFTWFKGDNELKLGADYQDISWSDRNVIPALFQGAGYNPNLPGGFATPQVMRIFEPADGPAVTGGKARALYAQDRLSWGDHWALTLGLRVEDQSHKNDAGTEVQESTDLAPRLAAVYDVGGDGQLLVKGTVGRYYRQVPEEVIDEFGVKPSGVNVFDEFRWNPATQRYDIFLRHFDPVSNPLVIGSFDPYYKDEATAGIEWQFSDAWAFEARGIYWEEQDLYQVTDQIAADGTIFRLLDDLGGERDYRGLQLELNRRFRAGWVLRSNYTLSRNEGTVFEASADDYLEAMAAVNPATGIPFTAENREGRGLQDRTHALNLSGAKVWQVGEHSLSFGGFFWYRTGEPWGRRVNFTINNSLVPNIRGTITTTRHTEPRDAHELPETMNLNLTGSWTFPLWSRVEGNLRLEAANVTDEQEQTLVNLVTGAPIPLRSGFQFSRELRAVAGVRF